MSGVLVVTNWRDLDHPSAGGAELVCERLAERMAADCFDQTIYLTAAVAGRPSVERRNGYVIVRRGGRFSVYPHALWWLRARRHHVAAVIDSQNGIPFFTPLALKRDTPVLLLMHHVHQEQMSGLPLPLAVLGRFLESSMTRWVYGSRAILAVSPSTRQEIRQKLRLTGPITVAPPGLDHHDQPRRVRAEAPRIVCVGRLVPHKRMHLIIRALPLLVAAYPTVEVHIVGDGPCRGQLEALAESLGVAASVIFHGSVPARVRDTLLATAWLSVNASAAEGWGVSVIEANALGVPVLALRRPGLKDSIQDGATGWLVDDEAVLAPAITSALAELADPVVARHWSGRARGWASRFTWEEMAERALRALAAERGKLDRTRERRVRSDVVTIAHVPSACMPDNWSPTFRTDDRVRYDPSGATLTLAACDTSNARLALERNGISPAGARNAEVVYRVARPADLLVSGNFVDLTTVAPDAGAIPRRA